MGGWGVREAAGEPHKRRQTDGGGGVGEDKRDEIKKSEGDTP